MVPMCRPFRQRTSRWEQRARSVSWQAWQHRHRNVNGAARRLMARLILRSVSASLAAQVSIGFPASSKCLTLGTRAYLEPQRGGKAVTVLPLVISRLHDNRIYSHATPPEFDDGNPTLLHAVMHEMFLCTCFERS